ncbi:hypothetical protein [Isoptericola sp. NPDC057391]|uniref:hypothetical protein n=1 Tax=Isoptericola sp. NPDC057391 TaxID=3346117 RepID=UPI00364099FC
MSAIDASATAAAPAAPASHAPAPAHDPVVPVAPEAPVVVGPTGHAMVSPRLRTYAYVVALVVGALATAASTITAAVAPGSAQTVTAVGGAVAGLFATISGGLGTAYRPTSSRGTT